MKEKNEKPNRMPTKGKRAASSRNTSKRTLVEGREGDRRYLGAIKRDNFSERSANSTFVLLIGDGQAETKVVKGQGDRGDTKRGGSVVERIVLTLIGR